MISALRWFHRHQPFSAATHEHGLIRERNQPCFAILCYGVVRHAAARRVGPARIREFSDFDFHD